MAQLTIQNTQTHTHTKLQFPGCCAYLLTSLWQGVFLEWGRVRAKEMRRRECREYNWRRGEGGSERGESHGRLITCLASSKDVCSLLNSFSYCSFILSTSWSWAATSSFRAPFKAVSSLSRLLRRSSCSSLARRISCISTFSCIMSCEMLTIWKPYISSEFAEIQTRSAEFYRDSKLCSYLSYLLKQEWCQDEMWTFWKKYHYCNHFIFTVVRDLTNNQGFSL